jgi:feruloyl esterase
MTVLLAAIALGGCVSDNPAQDAASTRSASQLLGICTPAAIQQALGSVSATKVTVKQISNGPRLADGVKYVAATDKLPAYCHVSGSFVTNPKTGKTANFLATLPENWNGKYLQLGCFSHCGSILINDAASFAVPIVAQGFPGQILIKGYATFSTDEGHMGPGAGDWAIRGPGKVNDDAIEDFFYRADEVLAKMGKQFAAAFYAKLPHVPQRIAYSYFAGCSGGGRDAFVAASYFPEEFDGIVGGSAYEPSAVAFHRIGDVLATIRNPGSDVSPALIALIDPIVKAQCDGLDGVEDGLIQNPAACNFNPMRDLPKCEGDEAGDQCFTQAQRETISVALTAVTDEEGNVVAPGYSISELQPSFRPEVAAHDPTAQEPWGETGTPIMGNWALGNAVLKIFAHKNDPAFMTRPLFRFGAGGAGRVTAFRSVVPASEVVAVRRANRTGIGHFPANWAKFLRQDRKFLMWHNWSDEALTPYLSINFYKELARRAGGYSKLQKNVRLFMLPGTTHCSIGGIGPNNFDALTAIENWVEKGQAPDAIPATLYSGSPTANRSAPPLRTMPLCKFPTMARYKGQGDVKDGSNWSCPVDDTSLLTVGESGKQAGVVE